MMNLGFVQQDSRFVERRQPVTAVTPRLRAAELPERSSKKPLSTVLPVAGGRGMGCPKRRRSIPQQDRLFGPIQLCLHGETNSILLGQPTELGKPGNKISCGVVFDIAGHQSLQTEYPRHRS
jgi:hypothetical protein